MSKTQVPWFMYLLLAVLGLALWLRVWGSSYGLPYELTMDETHEIMRAFKLGAGEYDWEGFGKGGLYYILFAEYAILYIVYWLMGWVANTREFALSFLQDRTVFYLLGRLTVALMGTLTCLVVFLIGRRLYDWRVGLGAAFIGATAYQDGVMCHEINVDTGMILAVWASVLAYLEYEKKAEQRWLIATGALVGVAIAFKEVGVMVCPFLLLAIGSRSDRWQYPHQLLKEAGIVLVTALATLTVMAPEWKGDIVGKFGAFSYLFAKKPALTGSYESSSSESIKSLFPMLYITTRLKDVFHILFEQYNIPLVISAMLGISLGLWHKHRWDILWAAFIVAFIALIVIGNRTLSDALVEAGSWEVPMHYLLPIMPALWLLSSRVIMTLSGERWWLATVGLACIVVLPSMALARQDYEWTQPDTRVLAKEWIEANVPSGARILMDGMRYRFIMSPPLNPNSSTLARQVNRAKQSEIQLSRGVSAQTLALYTDALEQVQGPKYELHSTEWGRAVKDLTYYVQNCFDYVITSSFITYRYASGETDRERFPQSVQFYEHLPTDPRFQKVYSVAPIPWQRTGYTISVYKVIPTCDGSQRNVEMPSTRDKR